MTKQNKPLDQLIGEFVSQTPQHRVMFDEEMLNFEASQLAYDLRTTAGLTRSQLAKKVGTTASVICRMEQADYDGSISMLRRIATAMNRRLELRAIPLGTRKKAS